MLDFVNVQLLRKRFCQMNELWFGYYYSYVDDPRGRLLSWVNYVGVRDENGVLVVKC